MKLDETLSRMNQEEKTKVLELLRGKADMNRRLLLSDCEERIKKAVPQNADIAIKAMYLMCDALTRTGKNIHVTSVKAEQQDTYRGVAVSIVEMIERYQATL